MRVPDKIRKCVAFIGCKNPTDQSFMPMGTVFFLAEPINSDKHFRYAVTAKHVIDKLRDMAAEKVCIRFNLRTSGTIETENSINDWFFHPTNAKGVDVAVAGIDFPNETDHLSIHIIDMTRTSEQLLQEGIGVGHEVFLPGLFSHHYGEEKNIPIVRVGNLATLIEERVKSDFGLIEAYLIEVKSMGGASGSPVFVNLGHIRVNNNQIEHSTSPDGVFYLIGLMQGHWDDTGPSKSNLEKINMGIGVVVPIDKILEVINQPIMLMLKERAKKLSGIEQS